MEPSIFGWVSVRREELWGTYAADTLVQTDRLKGVNVRRWLNEYLAGACWHYVKKA